MSFVDKTPRSASAIARGNVSLGIVDRDLLDHEYNKLSQDMRMVFRALVKRLRETTAKISAFSGRQD
jgi:CRP/FNR family transcriptional regulator